jgi:hypothetical protein
MRARIVPTVLAALALTSSLACTVSAKADTTTQPAQTFTTAGTYYVTVPDHFDGLELDGVGGAGYAGDPSSSGSSKGGAGGSGTRVHVTFGPAAFSVGDVFKIVVGAKGGGGQRGYGSELSGSGGNGGGATIVTDVTTGNLLLVAGGGGGGGGGSGLYIGYAGGRGGTAGDGTPGIGTLGGDAGRGGAVGQLGNCTQVVGQGGTGETAPTASAVGGGGGGGQGACGGGGQSGGSGEHGAGDGGGGGGGAGASYVAPFDSGVQYSAGTNTADGTVSVTFTTRVPEQPVITSPDCMYLGNRPVGGYLYVTATGYPLPTLGLLGGPSWLHDDGSGPEWLKSDAILTLQLTGAASPGQYRAQVKATNDAGSVVEPLTLVAGTDRPGFLSPDTATATAGSAFSFAVQAVECPPIQYYSISGQNDAPWLTIDRTTGELSGTPAASDVGTHTITVEASTGGVVGTTLTQTLTVQVNPAAVTPPPVTVPPMTPTGSTPPGSTPPGSTTNPPPPVTTTPPAPPATQPAPPAMTGAGGSAGSAPAAPTSPAVRKTSADLAVHLGGPATVRTGRTFTETVTVTNRGPQRASHVHVALRVPHGLTIADTTGALRHGRILHWSIPALSTHATRTYAITLHVVAHRRVHRTLRVAVHSSAVRDRHARNNHRVLRLLIVPR